MERSRGTTCGALPDVSGGPGRSEPDQHRVRDEYFICGAIGSALASFLSSRGGWAGVTLAAVFLSCFAFTGWLIGRRSALTARAISGGATT